MDGSDPHATSIPCFGAELAFKKDMEANEEVLENDT